MKNFKLIYTVYLFLSLISCTHDKKNNQSNNIEKITVDGTSIINKVDISKIDENFKIIDKKKLINIFFNSFIKDQQPSYVVFDQIKNNTDQIKLNKYIDLDINGIAYSTYILSFNYENDTLYQSIFLVNKKVNDGLILYEKVINEGEYLRISKISNEKIHNIQYEIEYYQYDKEGNIIGDKSKKDSSTIASNQFKINNDRILAFSKNKTTNKNKISDKWLGTYKIRLDYGEIGGMNSGWDLEININNQNITASGNGYQIDFQDQLVAKEQGNKLLLKYVKNIGGFSLGEDMNPEFILINDHDKYYVQSDWIDSDVLTKPEKNGYLIKKNQQ